MGHGTGMEIHVTRVGGIPLREQLAEQIVFQIATGKLQPGQALPSVREVARRLKIHHNTVSEAYQDLVRRQWLQGRRGRRVTVRAAEHPPRTQQEPCLDALINNLVRVAREQGFSLQALRQRVRERLLAAPPDHILIAEVEAGLGRLMQAEIRAAVNWRVEVCTRKELAANPNLSFGALVVAAHYAIPDVNPLLPVDRPAVPLEFGLADEQVQRIRRLRDPSVLAIVSVSEGFLQTARSLLATVVEHRHVLKELLFPLVDAGVLNAVDVVFADSIAMRDLQHRDIVPYRLIAPASLSYLVSALQVP